jgi:hypothetical protein
MDDVTKVVQQFRYIGWRTKWIIRRHAIVTRIKGPAHKRNPSYIEIDITSACNLRCKNCNRSCSQAPAEVHMTVPQIQRFVDESVQAGYAWGTISLIGGEPTVHPNLKAIVNILLEYKKKYSPETKIKVVTNGTGDLVQKVLREIPEDVVIKNMQKDILGYKHCNFNVAPCDSLLYKYLDFTNGCFLSTKCGTGLTPYGYYTCPMAGFGIDRIFGYDLGRKRLSDPDDQLLEQRRILCRLCGHFEGWSYSDSVIVSPTWVKAYEKYKTLKPKMTFY